MSLPKVNLDGNRKKFRQTIPELWALKVRLRDFLNFKSCSNLLKLKTKSEDIGLTRWFWKFQVSMLNMRDFTVNWILKNLPFPWNLIFLALKKQN